MGLELVGLKGNEWTCKRGIYARRPTRQYKPRLVLTVLATVARVAAPAAAPRPRGCSRCCRIPLTPSAAWIGLACQCVGLGLRAAVFSIHSVLIYRSQASLHVAYGMSFWQVAVLYVAVSPAAQANSQPTSTELPHRLARRRAREEETGTTH